MKKKYLNLSLCLSLVSIAITIFINIKIAQRYIMATGKTRALFGLTELLQFGYQYYIVFIGAGSFILAVLNIKSNEQQTKKVIAVVLSAVAVAIVFTRIWRLFV